MFRIYIPSRGRAHKPLTTLLQLPPELLSVVTIVVPQKEVEAYILSTQHNVVGVDDSFRIAETRQAILEMDGPRYIFMMDDDMVFYERIVRVQPKLEARRGELLMPMFDLLYNWLANGIVQVGLSARQGNNWTVNLVDHVDCTRAMNFYGFDRLWLNKRGIRFDRVPIMEDLDVTLQLLRRGRANRVMYHYCWNQLKSGSEGGCSVWRTPEVQTEGANALAALHPDFVKVVTKKSKSGWEGMATRTDTRVQWRKAYQEGCKL